MIQNQKKKRNNKFFVFYVKHFTFYLFLFPLVFPMQTNNFRNMLLRDYTLFELSDPKILSYYLDKREFFTKNFAYFKDIDIVSEFLTANELFCEKFDLEAFINVLNYNINDSYLVDQCYLTNNKFSTVCLYYKKVLLHYFKRKSNKKVFNKALNTILYKTKQIKIEDDDSFLSCEILNELAAVLILLNLKKVNLKIFFNKSQTNIRLLREITTILDEREDYNCTIFNNELIRNRQILINEYVRLAFEIGSIEKFEEKESDTDLCNKLKNIKLTNNQFQMENTLIDIYEILSFMYERMDYSADPIKIDAFKLKKLDLYSTYYLRIYSVEIKQVEVDYLKYLLDLMFRNKNNSFLLHSVFRVVSKTCYDKFKCLKIEVDDRYDLFLTHMVDYLELKLKEKYLMQPILDQIYAFLAKFYIKNKQKFIEKYNKEINFNRTEYEGFDRYVVTKMIDELPVSSVFMNEFYK